MDDVARDKAIDARVPPYRFCNRSETRNMGAVTRERKITGELVDALDAGRRLASAVQ